MAVPKKKVSRSRRGNRRSHDTLVFKVINECSNCGAEKLPHHVCASCGYYNKKKVFSINKSPNNNQE